MIVALKMNVCNGTHIFVEVSTLYYFFFEVAVLEYAPEAMCIIDDYDGYVKFRAGGI